jgi:HD-GYP domain-containing protein (c-di-GMP phosphodiesterase class II)
MLNEREKLKKIIQLSKDISQVKDQDLLLERILLEARRFTNADAGSIYVVEGDKLKFSNSQNDTQRRKLPPGKKLPYLTFKVPIDKKSISGYVASTGEILNIPDVYNLPKDVPYSFGKSYDESSGYRSKSMLTVPLKNYRGIIIGVLQLINAQNEKNEIISFSVEDEPLILLFANDAAIALERAQMTRSIILRMISMAELRDPKETGPHVNRVASYSVEIYEAWANKKGIAQEAITNTKDVLRSAAMLHDVGKVAISDLILKKPARFTPEEYAIIKQHTFLGARLFLNPQSDFDDMASQVALNHHERWDGDGYPGYIDVATGQPLKGYITDKGTARGKKGEEIPFSGRLVAIADVYDALSCRRCYKEPWDESNVLEELRGQSGKQFDPEMIDAFFSILDVIRSIASQYPDKE